MSLLKIVICAFLTDVLHTLKDVSWFRTDIFENITETLSYWGCFNVREILQNFL